MSLVGMASGAAKSLEEIVAARLQRQILEREVSDRQKRFQLETDRVNESKRSSLVDEGQRQQTIDGSERSRRDQNNERGLRLMQADKGEMDLDAAIGGLPAHLKPLGGLMKAGAVGKLSPEDLQDPSAVAAEAQAKKDGEFTEWKRRQDYNEGQLRNRPKDAPAPKAPGKMPASMANSVAAAQTSLAGLDRLEALYSDDKVGPVAGRYNKVERSMPSAIAGMMPDAPKDFEEFAAESATLKNQVIQAITGAAVGVKEQERIMGQIPDVSNTPANWKARAKATRRNLEALKANQVQMGTGATDDVPAAAVDAAQPSAEITYQRDPKTGKLVRVGG